MSDVVENLKNGIKKLLPYLAITMILYQLLYIYLRPYEPQMHAIFHFGFALTVVILNLFLQKKRSKVFAVFYFAILVLGIVVCIYFIYDYSIILQNPSSPPQTALVMGVIGSIIAIIIAGQSFGWVFPSLVIIGALYTYYGNHLPGVFSAPSIPLRRAVVLLASDVTSSWGLIGNLLVLSANYLFLFIIFGALLNAFGAMNFVQHLGNFVASKVRSGAAAMAIVSSALLGSITGSSVANVSVTGSFTIPLMKKSGYDPEQAAAIEAATSNGGQFLPPIMGATVFVMASFTGIRYIDIAAAAIIPAVLYFGILFLYAELNAIKKDFSTTEYDVNVKDILLDAPIFVIPFAVLIGLMIVGFSLMMVIFYTIIVLVIMGLAYGYFRKDANVTWEVAKDKLLDGVTNGSKLAIVLAAIGIFVAALDVTGFSINLSMVLGGIAGDNLVLMLILVMVTSIILGIGVPTPAAYIVVATTLSPMLIEMGVPTLHAHLFPLFFAIVSHLTPPVGIALLIASNIAGSHYYRSAWETAKAAYPVLILPFIFVSTPSILLEHETTFELVADLLGAAVLLLTISIILNRHWKYKISMAETWMLLISMIATGAYIFVLDEFYLLALGVPLCIIALIYNSKKAVLKKS